VASVDDAQFSFRLGLQMLVCGFSVCPLLSPSWFAFCWFLLGAALVRFCSWVCILLGVSSCGCTVALRHVRFGHDDGGDYGDLGERSAHPKLS
jgi:hypothetical protein